MNEGYPRLLDKALKPTQEKIALALGEEAAKRLDALETHLTRHYDLQKELRFPFGNRYGWGYKYRHRSHHLCYAFFEQGAFTVTLQISGKDLDKMKEIYDTLQPETRELWENRYPCGEGGGWIHYRILSDAALADVIRLIAIKRPHAK